MLIKRYKSTLRVKVHLTNTTATTHNTDLSTTCRSVRCVLEMEFDTNAQKRH